MVYPILGRGTAATNNIRKEKKRKGDTCKKRKNRKPCPRGSVKAATLQSYGTVNTA